VRERKRRRRIKRVRDRVKEWKRQGIKRESMCACASKREDRRENGACVFSREKV
jgi:hypothetical protein